MTAPNTAHPGDTVVPSAQAERQRIWDDDRIGLIVYGVATAVFVVVVVMLVIAAR